MEEWWRVEVVVVEVFGMCLRRVEVVVVEVFEEG